MLLERLDSMSQIDGDNFVFSASESAGEVRKRQTGPLP